MLSCNLHPGCVTTLEAFAPREGVEGAGIGDEAHARAMRRLAAAGVRAFNPLLVERLSRVRLSDMVRFYPEVMLAWDVRHFGTLALWLPEGPVLLSHLTSRDRPRRLAERELEVLSLLAPGLEAGMWMVRSVKQRAEALGAAIDEIDTPALLWWGGGSSYRNRRLGGLLETLPDVEGLVDAMVRLAEDVSRMEGPARKSTEECRMQSGSRTLVVGRRRLRLHASRLPPGTVGGDPAVLVLVRTPIPLLDARTLRDRFSLTPRQAQVARLLAFGASNHAIARRLGISPHTARHHAQRVLEKTGMRSRKALGLRLIDSGLEEPSSSEG